MYPNGGYPITVGDGAASGGSRPMNYCSVALWTAIGAGAGVLMAPTTTWQMNPGRHHGVGRALLASMTGIAFAAMAARSPTLPELLAYSIFAAAGIQLAVIDACTHTLPRALVWPSSIAVSCVLVAAAVVNDDGDRLLAAAFGGTALVAFYLAIALTSRGGLGAGDVRAAFLIGSVLGWHGWPGIFVGSLLAFVGTGAVALVRREHRSGTPHGPALVAGTLLALLL